MTLNNDGQLILSVGRSRHDRDWKPKTMTWGELLERLSHTQYTAETQKEYHDMSRDEKGAAKDVGGFVGGALEGQRKVNNLRSRCLLALDADYGTPALWDTLTCLYGYAACMYSTHSHTPEKPRLRFLLPLKRPVQREEYEAIARKVASYMDIEAFDDTTYESTRLMYWPSTPADGEYLFSYHDGPWLDPDQVLGDYPDWRNVRDWPLSSRQQRVMERRVSKQGDPCEKPGLIGAFNRIYNVPAAIEKFLPGVYAQAGDGRYTYVDGSTSGGLVIYDNGDFAYSHHDTDPASGLLCSAFDLVRIHKFGALDDEVEPDTPINEYPSYDAMRLLAREDKEVLESLESRIRSSVAEDFAAEAVDQLLQSESDFTEQGNAVAFAKAYKGLLCWQDNLRWCYWDGEKWIPDSEQDALMLVLRFADKMLDHALHLNAVAATKPEIAHAKEAAKWAKASRSESRIAKTLKLARVLLSGKRLEDFDADPWALNTPAGLINLRTGEVLPKDSGCMCTQITSTAPSPGDAPRWQALLDGITGGDKELERYLQDVAGMALVGAVYEEGITIAYGPGGNGKSTFFGIWADVLGTYAGTIRPELLVPHKGGNEPFGLEKVRGKRLVIASETEEGASLSVSVMKRLTSQDRINANPKNRDPFDFEPTHTLVLHTNHLPKIRAMDDGVRRRLALIPMLRKLSHDEIITDLRKTIVENEAPQILYWMIEGTKRFYANHMKLYKPSVVEAATREYANSEDWVTSFLDECCDVGPGYTCQGGVLYQTYLTWGRDNGEFRPMRNRDFAKALETNGFSKKKCSDGSRWAGLRPKPM